MGGVVRARCATLNAKVASGAPSYLSRGRRSHDEFFAVAPELGALARIACLALLVPVECSVARRRVGGDKASTAEGDVLEALVVAANECASSRIREIVATYRPWGGAQPVTASW